VLGKNAANAIPRAALVEFEELGHSPQVQDSEMYHEALFTWLGKSDW
jgi:pimeloyl-ACP methyl ester carboxylesterase